MHADMHHTYLMHTPPAHLYAGMVDALVCTQTSHTAPGDHDQLSITTIARGNVLALRPDFADRPRELSRVS